jgi:coenzyme F420-reducing hydrogenase alpha subunit
LLPNLKSALDDMCELTLYLAQNLDYPDFEQDYEYVSLMPEDEYPMNQGCIVSNKGVNIAQEEYLDVFEERHVPHSNALHSVVKARGCYHVGPLARLNLCSDRLHPRAAELLPKVCAAVGHNLPWNNSFLSLPARGLETVHSLAYTIDVLENYKIPSRSFIPITTRAGVGCHGTEAPRGLLWHRYETDSEGTIVSARIIPPTSQNQLQIEADLKKVAEQFSDMDDDRLCLRCEQLIRNYDPCISCATHFLKLHVEQVT